MSYSSEYKNPNYAYESLKNLTSYTCQSQCMCPLYGKERTAYDKMLMKWSANKKEVPFGSEYHAEKTDAVMQSWRKSIE